MCGKRRAEIVGDVVVVDRFGSDITIAVGCSEMAILERER